jgi:tetratricopeptide (TPR) repeat protein
VTLFRYKVFAILLIAMCSPLALADGQSDAQKLKDEALEILKANANKQATAAQYANCIFKLEQAQSILEKAGDHDSNLSQEVNTTLFWARRFSNVQIINELDKLRGGGKEPPPVPKSVEPPKPPPAAVEKDAPPEPPAAMADAKKAFDTADKFAKSHAGDDYAVALSWFKMANDHSGTDYALKALSLAREAQSRFATKSSPAPKEVRPDTPEMKMVAEGEKLAEAHKFDEAISVLKGSLAKNETMVAHSTLGHAYFDRGQQLKDELLPKIEAADKEYRDAWRNAFTVRRGRRVFDPSNSEFVSAKQKCDELGKQSFKAVDYYDKAESEFKAALRMAPDKRDLDAAGHVGLCLSVHGDINFRLRAQTVLNQFLSDYSPATDLERSLYEFCKTELARIRKL